MITIIIPTYKRPQMLGNAIKSALAQTTENIQIFVCDNASQDETPLIVEKFRQRDKRVHYFSHKTNVGMIANYAFGVSLVTTKYFSFLSDDDLLLPSFCKTALQDFAKYPDIAFAASSTLIVNQKYALLAEPLALWNKEGYFPPCEGALAMIGKYPVPNTVLFCTERVKPIPIDHTNAVMWDCDFLLKVAIRYPIAISKQQTGLFFGHNHSFTRTIAYKQWIEANDKLLLNIEDSSVIIPQQIKTEITAALIQQGIFYAIRGMLRSYIDKDKEAALYYENILRSQQKVLTFKSKLYWTLFKLRRGLPFLRICLKWAWTAKNKRGKKISHFEKIGCSG